MEKPVVTMPSNARSSFLISYSVWHGSESFQTVLFAWYVGVYLQLDSSTFGMLQALNLAPFVFLVVFFGFLSDKIGAQKVFLSGAALFSVSLVLFSVYLPEKSDDFELVPIILFCILSGVSSALCNPSADTFIPQLRGDGGPESTLVASRAANLGKIGAATLAIGITLTSPRWSFLANSAMIVFSIYFFAKFLALKKRFNIELKSSNVNTPSLDSNIIALIVRTRSFLAVSFLFGMFIVPMVYMTWALISNHLEDVGKGGPFALVFVAFWISSVISTQFSIGWRGNRKNLVLGLLSFLTLSVMFLHMVENFSSLLVAVFVFGLSLGPIKPIFYSRFLERCTESYRGTMIAVDQLVFWGTAVVGSLFLGRVSEFGASTGAAVCAALFFVGMLAVIFSSDIFD
ncbi:MFS transporter [uncultured Ruegeria sp.]|uniref:MFS transporter n=1 Tax=uncultured Ruegeria sp. TaxID=259304 RepID=UPI0026044A0F|nr:MFS transporter [uncultured Ruegeria sp.]